MTIEKGKDWGEAVQAPESMRVVHSDQAVATLERGSTFSVTHGDLWRSLGCPLTPSPGQQATRLPIDCLEYSLVTADGEIQGRASSSIEVGQWKSLNFGRLRRFVCVSNNGFVGGHNFFPRAHPNDGFFEVLTMDIAMVRAQRFLSYRRLRTGTHLPHPNLRTSRLSEITIEPNELNEKLRIDGAVVKNWAKISVHLEADFWQALV